MTEPSKAYKLLSDLESHLENSCETLEKEFEQDLDSFQMNNFQIEDSEVVLRNRQTRSLNTEVKEITQSVSVKIKFSVSMNQANPAKLIAEFQDRLDNSLLNWSRNSKWLERPINNIEGSPEVNKQFVSLSRNFDLVYRD
jgi:hypothetical protein